MGCHYQTTHLKSLPIVTFNISLIGGLLAVFFQMHSETGICGESFHTNVAGQGQVCYMVGFNVVL